MIFGTGVFIRKPNGDILIGKRSDGKGWCGGGGHIEDGETPRMAAYRETVEELGIYPIGLSPLGEVTGPGYKSYIFIAENFYGEPKSDGIEMITTRWVSPVELNFYDLYEPFKKSIRLLPATLNNYTHHYTLDPIDQPPGVIQYDEDSIKTITLNTNDPYNSIENLIDCIKLIASSGHSFKVVVDPGNDGEQEFWIDGDGPDRIERMEVTANGAKDSKQQTINTGKNSKT